MTAEASGAGGSPSASAAPGLPALAALVDQVVATHPADEHGAPSSFHRIERCISVLAALRWLGIDEAQALAMAEQARQCGGRDLLLRGSGGRQILVRRMPGNHADVFAGEAPP